MLSSGLTENIFDFFLKMNLDVEDAANWEVGS